jgi:hypothetical protein
VSKSNCSLSFKTKTKKFYNITVTLPEVNLPLKDCRKKKTTKKRKKN